MEKIYHDLSLDFNETHTLKVVRIKQFDRFGRRIRLNLYNNGKAVSLDSNGDTATLFASINGVATAVGDTCDIENNAIIVHVGLPMTSIAGTEKCEVRVESINGRVHTATFDILVEPSTVTDDTPKIISSADIFGKITLFNQELAEIRKEYLSKEQFRTQLQEFSTQVFGATCNVNYDAVWLKPLNGFRINKSDYNPNNGDVVLIWANNEILTPGTDYILNEADEYWEVAQSCFTQGMYLTVQIWNVPKDKTAASGQAIVLSSGTAESIDGKSYVSLTGTAKSVSGRAGKVIEVESGTVNLLEYSLVVDKLGSPINNFPNVTVSERFAIPEGKKVTVYADYDGRKNFDLNFNFISSEDGKEYFFYGKTPYERGIASGQTLIRPHLFLDYIDNQTFDISKLTEFYMTVE